MTKKNLTCYTSVAKKQMYILCALVAFSLFFQLPFSYAQNPTSFYVTDNCGATVFDDGGISNNYDDSADRDDNRSNGVDPFVYLYCPTDPVNDRVQLNFTAWDVAEGDFFAVYDTGEPFQLDSDGLVKTDAYNNPLLASNLPEPYNVSNPVSGNGVSKSPGSGWVKASCTNESGCLTVVWQPNNDGKKGAGWRYLVECEANEYQFDCPNDVLIPINCNDSNTNIGTMYTIPSVPMTCLSETDYTVAVSSVSPTPSRAINADGTTASLPYEAGTQLVYNNINSSITLTYQVYALDTDGDITGAAINTPNANTNGANYACRQVITPSSNAPLACNNRLNVSLDPQACSVKITADMLLENPCAGESYTVDIEGLSSSTIYEPGTYSVSVYKTADDSYSCWGYVVVEDKSAPVCQGRDYDANNDGDELFRPWALCTDYNTSNLSTLFADTEILFDECSATINRTYSYESIVECGDFSAIDGDEDNFSTNEQDLRDDVLAALNQHLADLVAAGTLSSKYLNAYSASNSSLIATRISVGSTADDMIYFTEPNSGELFLVQNIVIQSASANDNSAYGNNSTSSDDCNFYVAILSPDKIYVAPSITIECTGSTHPDNLPAEATPYFVFGLDDNNEPIKYGIAGTDHEVCNISATYSDDGVIATCGNTSKTIRRWTVLNWCSGSIQTLYREYGSTATYQNPQVLKTEDNEAPVITLPNSGASISLNNFSCDAGKITLPAIQVTDNCSSVDVKVTFNGQTINGNGGSFLNIAIGTYMAVYTATDACGNTSSVELEVGMADSQPPIAICETYRKVSMISSCKARIYADSFDDGSYDNCTPKSELRIDVRRMDGTDADFGPYVEFDDTDLADGCGADGIMVIMRVRDAGGNENRCMVEVSLEDKIAPTCTSKSLAGNCIDYGHLLSGQSTASLNTALDAIFGTPEVADNCGEVSFNYGTPVIETGDCGTGKITRTFKAVDACGNESNTCSQMLTITGESDWKITFPTDYNFECTGNASIPAKATLNDLLTYNNGCDQLGLEVKEETYTASDDACYKIIRTYRVINWCLWTPNSTPVYVDRPSSMILNESGKIMLEDEDAAAATGFMVYRQIITVIDNEGPSIAIDHTTKDDDDDDCAEEQQFTIRTNDGCSDKISGRYSIIGNSGEVANGSFSSSPYTFATIPLPLGGYQILVTAQDGCGNYSTQKLDFTVKDGKAPAPICIAQLQVAMMPNENGMMELWASDLIVSDATDCSGPVRYSFSDTKIVTGLTVSNLCAAIAGDGDAIVSEEVPFEITGEFNLFKVFAWDEAGNVGTCDEIAVLINNNCSAGGGMAMIAGAITTESGEQVEEVEVTLNGNLSMTMMTESNGSFMFDELEMGYDYSVKPAKNINNLNGVSTYDILLMTKHILGIAPLDSPYKIIAADVNNSGTVTTFDIIQLRRLILNIDKDFQNNTSWRFIDAYHTFAYPSNPWATSFKEFMNVNNLEEDMMSMDFVAVKVGDVSGNAKTNQFAQTTERSPIDVWTIETKEAHLSTAETYTMTFEVADMNNIEGYQFTIDFDTDKLELVDIESGIATLDNFGTTKIAEGKLMTSWNRFENVDMDQPLFQLTFKAKQNTVLSQAVRLTSEELKAEAYNDDLELLEVALAFDKQPQATAFEVYQNTPNPFTGTTTIGFTLPQAEDVSLGIYDISGKQVLLQRSRFEAGYNEIQVASKDLTAGVLYYTISTGLYTQTKKMVVVE